MEDTRVTPGELGLPETIPLPKRTDWRIGIVGFGSIARHAHVPAYRSAGWQVVAAAGPRPAAQKSAREEFGIGAVYDNFAALIADKQVEVIDLCTQPSVRTEVVSAAAAAGKHVIIEKPLAESLAECERMVQVADEAGIKLAVHQNYRWLWTCFLAHHAIKRGLIGDPFLASIEIVGGQDVGAAGHPFYSKCQNFLTVQWDNHLADLLRYWTGRSAKRVLARTGRMKGQNFVSDNLLTVIADFGEGLTGHVLHSELLRSSLGGVRCRVDGDKGSIVFDFNATLRIESSVLGEGVRKLDLSGLSHPLSWCGTMGDLLISIEDDREPLVSARRNLATMRTIVAEDESARKGGVWVECGAG